MAKYSSFLERSYSTWQSSELEGILTQQPQLPELGSRVLQVRYSLGYAGWYTVRRIEHHVLSLGIKFVGDVYMCEHRFSLVDSRLFRILLVVFISALAVLGTTIATQDRVTTEVPFQQSRYYTLKVVPGSLTLRQDSTTQAVIAITSLNGFSETRECGSAWWGHLNLRASVSHSTTLDLLAVVNPTCLTLKSGETATATLVVSATRLVVPGVYHFTVSVGFQVSPSGWSSGSSTVVSVHVIPNEPPVFGRG